MLLTPDSTITDLILESLENGIFLSSEKLYIYPVPLIVSTPVEVSSE